MPKVFTSPTQKIGEVGENVAVEFLVKHGFKVLDRNYTKKWGEIDIIAQKDNRIHFIEVKSVSRDLSMSVPRETDEYRAEDNMHPWKMQRMSRTIETYLLSKRIEEEVEWQVDLVVVYLDTKSDKSIVEVVKDIIL